MLNTFKCVVYALYNFAIFVVGHKNIECKLFIADGHVKVYNQITTTPFI